MCGRYSMSDPRRCIAEFSLVEKHPALEPRYNIAPSQGVWVVRMLETGEGRRLDLLRWGLVMPGSKARSRNAGVAMVRVESLARAAFGSAFRSRRCLLLADGFYEWRRAGKRSFPYDIHRPDRTPFAMAGIWYPAPPAEGEREGPAPLDSCAVITCPARPPVDAVHDRMPAILASEHHEKWLNPDFDDTGALAGMLGEDPGFSLETVQVGPRVNSPANDDPACVAPATDAERGGEQFELWPRHEAFRTG
jgi:putative SOS response-associated peptidase YedK